MATDSVRKYTGTSPWFIGYGYAWDETRGREVTATYEGPETDLKTQELIEIEAGATSTQLNQVEDSPDWRLVATYPFDPEKGVEEEAPVNTYELLSNELQQPTSQNAVLIGLVEAAGGADTDILETHDIYERYSRGEVTYSDAKNAIDTLADGDTTLYGILSDYFHDLMRGVDQYFNHHYVLRRTITVVHPDQVKASFTGIGKVWTGIQVRNFENLNEVEASLNFNLPVGYSWLKKAPNVVSASNKRTEIVYEYWGADEWDEKYYEAWDGNTAPPDSSLDL
jgi:hypothetical protein